MKFRNLWIGALIVGIAAFAALRSVSQFRPAVVRLSAAEIDAVALRTGLADCFWVGVVTPGGFNLAYPDTAANYWTTQFRLPEGASLELSGEFPHARHLSFNTYDDEGRPVDRLNDIMMAPQAGATNPFVVGARRDASRRDYRLRVAQTALAAGTPMAEIDGRRPVNTIFAPQGSEPTQLAMRIYVQDQGLDAKAGVALPRPVMTLADGRTVQGEALCREIVIKEGAVRDVRMAREQNTTLLQLASSTSPYHPAQPDAPWAAFFNPPYVLTAFLVGTRFEGLRSLLGVKRKGGFYSTLDNTYMFAAVDRRFGDLLVLQGKAPTTPRTLAGTALMQAGQLRYWSLCKYRSLHDTAVDSCLFDEQVPLDAEGNYTIIVSAAEQRPGNARAACGVAWLDWGVGDGIANPAGGMLVYRHMLPAHDFTQSLFATREPGDEPAVLGVYYPKARYQSRAEFEARGCATPKSWASSRSGP